MLGDQPRTLANGRVTTGEVNRALAHILERAQLVAADRDGSGDPDKIATYFADFGRVGGPLTVDIRAVDRDTLVVDEHTTGPDGRVTGIVLGLDKWAGTK